ncbi:MAG: penicillin-binding protein 2 [Verrucomicrobia bacterium]|nr:penicillin-binding protein 2 [Verrucomicrobiota bacterium]
MLIIDQLRRGDKRLRAVAAAIALWLFVLVVGLWYIQVVSADKYRASLVNQTFRNVRIPANRGVILDRNGLSIADNKPSYNLELYLEELRPLFDAEFTRARAGRPMTRAERDDLRWQVRYSVVSKTVHQLGEFLQEPLSISEHDFRRHYNQWPYRPITIRENLAPAQVARFLEGSPNLPGIDLEIRPLRYYPLGLVTAHVVGYLTRDDLARDDDEGGFSYSLPTYKGAVGIEHACDAALRGSPGMKSIVVNSLCYRESETVWTRARPGQNVVLTLDLPLQKAAYDALNSVAHQVRGAVVVLDAYTGDVLALVSSPSYDPNEFTGRIADERWQAMSDPKLRPMFNRATQGAYPPGSTFKIVTALACLESGVLNESTLTNTIYNPGHYQLGRRRIEDLAPAGYYDFKRGFKRSSNFYFIHYGLMAGRDRILSLGRRFHLGQRIGLPTRQESPGSFPTPEEVKLLWNDGNTANLCIGQEITVTPLQMALLTAAVANGGRVMYPRLISRIEPAEPGIEEGNTTDFQPRVRSFLNIPEQHLALIREVMIADTEEPEGTAYLAFHEADRVTPRLKGFRVGGKTGTAQIKEGNRVVDHITWFVSFGPGDSPRYVVVVMVESGASGGLTCAPVACKIYQAIQKRLVPVSQPAPALAQSE